MKNIFHIICFSLFLTSCLQNSNNKVGVCCYETYTNVNSAINCFNQTLDGNGTSSDERLILIAFVSKDVEANQKLGWEIIKDTEIIKVAKRNYALVILDAKHYKILNNQCSSHIDDTSKNNQDNVVFVIVNQALCRFNDWTFDDKKESIINKLQIGNGP